MFLKQLNINTNQQYFILYNGKLQWTRCYNLSNINPLSPLEINDEVNAANLLIRSKETQCNFLQPFGMSNAVIERYLTRNRASENPNSFCLINLNCLIHTEDCIFIGFQEVNVSYIGYSQVYSPHSRINETISDPVSAEIFTKCRHLLRLIFIYSNSPFSMAAHHT